MFTSLGWIQGFPNLNSGQVALNCIDSTSACYCLLGSSQPSWTFSMAFHAVCLSIDCLAFGLGRWKRTNWGSPDSDLESEGTPVTREDSPLSCADSREILASSYPIGPLAAKLQSSQTCRQWWALHWRGIPRIPECPCPSAWMLRHEDCTSVWTVYRRTISDVEIPESPRRRERWSTNPNAVDGVSAVLSATVL